MSGAGQRSECGCGRIHDTARRPRRRPALAEHASLVASIFDARAEGKAVPGHRFGEWSVHYAKDCEHPVRMRRVASGGAILADYFVRCRRCPPCLRARRWRWARAASKRILEAKEAGRRTWFVTLTLRPAALQMLLDRAIDKHMPTAPGSLVPAWFFDQACDLRMKALREELVRELQLMFKRLRKAGHKLKYFVVFERHKTGEPHVHLFVHEEADQILQKDLYSQWPHGFANAVLLFGRSKAACKLGSSPERAAFYITKYISKDFFLRPLVSQKYEKC